ncbi:hypothetical protein IQ288_31645 [Burkholderia sp. R-69980]|nr:hypothetical protein [Burkholderia sp. R-69980]
MAFERWGSLSVSDHIDAASLAANVLLYDRLVIPVMAEQPDRDVRAYWNAHGWDPDLQAKRLEQLGELAVWRPWNAARRDVFKTRMSELSAEQFDAQNIDDFHMTRMILAQERVTEKLPGVQHVQVIAAYNSADAIRQDFLVDDFKGNLSTQALLLGRRLAVPVLDNPEETLLLARDLSRDAEFRRKRAALFEWQEPLALRGIGPEAIVERLAEMSDAYNTQVKAATRKVYWKFAFTVFGIGTGFATGGAAALATGGLTALAAGGAAALALIQFVTLDSKPAIEPDTSRPAAMFHDIEAHVGLHLGLSQQS